MTIQAPVILVSAINNTNSGSAGAASSTAAAPAGGLIVVPLNATTTGGSKISSVTDSGGNTYNLIQPGVNGSVWQPCLAWCFTSVALPIGTTWTSSNVNAQQWNSRGPIYIPGAQGGLDKFSTVNYNSTAITQSTLPATQPLYISGEIAIGYLQITSPPTNTVSSGGFTTLSNGNSGDFSYQIQNGIGAVTYQPTMTTAVGTFGSVLAVFLPSLGTGVIGVATSEW